MSHKPYFPKPTGQGAAYRELDTSARASSVPDTSTERPVPKMVTRARPPEELYSDPGSAHRKSTPATRHGETEHTFWTRHSFARRHPRLLGALITLPGGLLSAQSVSVALHGGVYSSRASLLGPVALAAGLWLLAAGYPLSPDGHPPSWWVFGYVATIAVGVVLGIVLFALCAF